MIFYNNQLMKNENQLRMYLVSNPVPFSRFEDHEAALQIQLHELVETAIEKKEDPIMLFEEILKRPYLGGQTADEIASFIYSSDVMFHAMHSLKENWDALDETLPEDSVKYFAGTTKEQATEIFTEITLRTYLEALAEVYNQ